MKDSLGEFFCPSCGMREITNPQCLTVLYPKGAKKPKVKIKCDNCGKVMHALVEWGDALVFDFNGAKVEGFSFSRGAAIKAEEIETFISNFDKEVDEFLTATEQN